MPLFASLASFGLALLVITAILSEITTLVGSGGAGFFNGSVQFNQPYGVAVDSEGNVYIGDNGNKRVRKITPAGVVTTLAGQTTGGTTNGTGTNARFNRTQGVAVDSAGNVYVADQTSNLIRKITSAGVVTTLAGSGQTTPFTDGTGTNATFYYPTGVTVDSLGNVYVADQTNHRIRRITPEGVVTTVAGNGGTTFADGAGTNATFNNPSTVAVDSVGNVYVADSGNNCIRRITSERVTTLAGSGVNGSANGTGTNASFGGVISSTVDLIGNVYIADQFNHRIRKITSSGVMTTLAGSGTIGSSDGTGTNATFSSPRGIAVDSAGNLYVADHGNHRIRRIVPELVSTFATDLYQASSVTVDSLGNVYSVASSRIYKTTPAGVSTVFAGDGSQAFQDGTGTSARFWDPQGLACDSAGNVYLADNGNNRIRKITPAGVVTTLAGATQGFQDGTGTNARFDSPRGVAVDSTGNVYVVEQTNNRIRRITPEGVVTTLAGSGTIGSADGTGTNASFNSPQAIAVDSAGNVYVSDTFNQLIRKITPAGVVTTLAGGGFGNFNDGAGTNASFNNLRGLIVDSAGNVYVSEVGNHRIRRITPEGVVSTFAGTGQTSPRTDGATSLATFNQPNAVALDSVGNIYVSESGNNCIRKITLESTVTTLAGSTSSGSTDGTGTNASFYGPTGIAVDSGGVVYVADTANQRIRKITFGGNVVTTLAGSTQGSLNGVGTLAQFWNPSGVAVDSTGIVYVADNLNNLIRKITPEGVVSTLAGGSPFGFQDGTGTNARFSGPYGVAVDSAGTVYVAETSNRRVRRITPAGVVTTLAGNGNNATTDGIGTAASFSLPFGVAVDSIGSVYVANVNLIRKIPVPVVSTIAGSVTAGFADGLRTSAQFNNPLGITVDSVGNLYVTDYINNRIRKITSAGLVTTFAGSGIQGYADGLGIGASFKEPTGIAIDSTGIVYLAEQTNPRIRKISPAGLVTTMAGSSASGFANSIQATIQFNYPIGIAVDSAGVVYVADTSNYRIRKITPAGVVTTFAGSGQNTFANGTGINAEFGAVYGLTVDSMGTVYVADSSNYLIRKITPGGVVTTLAGSTQGSTDGTGTNATFTTPWGVAIDSTGNVYVPDKNNHRIRKITPAGVVTTLAGSLSNTLGSADGTGTSATFNNPQGVAMDSAGNMYVVDNGSHRIRKITPEGVVTTLAGSTQGSTDGTGTNATFNQPSGVAVDSAGNVYAAEFGNNRIRKITPAGVVTTLAGSLSNTPGSTDGTGTNASFSYPYGVAVDSTGNVYVADNDSHRIRKITPAGVVTTLAGSTGGYNDGGWFNKPVGVATDWDGTVYVADQLNNRIRKITPAGAVTTFAGAGNFSAGIGSFAWPRGVALDSNLNVYVADMYNLQIRRVTPEGTMTIFAGSGLQGTVDGTGTNARFGSPAGITIDATGTIYVTDSQYPSIRRITSAGVVTRFAGNNNPAFADGVGTNTSFNSPSGIVADTYGNLYVADTNNHRIRRITSDGTVTTLAGQATPGYLDGIGINARFNFPYHLSIDALGTLYVADQTNNRIRTVQTSTGVVSTLAGDGTAGFTPSRFNTPQGITVDRFRNAYVGDTGNHSIRKIPNVYTVPENNGVVTTFAGEGVGGFLDGMGIGARFNQPAGVAIDSMGTLYIADQGQHRIRRITPAGVVTVFAGSTTIGATNGTGTNATFSNPRGVAVDSAGNVYVADSNNNRIRRITSTGVVTTFAGSGTPAFLDGTGTNASFQFPTAIAVDSFGNVFVADQSNHRIRRITPAGVVTTLAGGGTGTFVNGTGTNAAFNSPTGIAVDSGGIVYVGDQSNHRIRRITPEGVVTTFAGATQGFQDGTGTNASFYQPNGIAVDSAGFVYVTDYLNHRIRKITSAGVVTTLAGSGTGQGTSTGSFANGTGTNASFGGPYAVAVDSAGNLYVAEWSNNRIRKIGTTVAQVPLNRGVVTTLAGQATFTPFSDGTGTNATFANPWGVAVDSTGHAYVADAGNHRIRKITPAGVVTTLAGSGTAGSTNGTGAGATFNEPFAVAVDSGGNVYIADRTNHRIRRITPGGTVTTLAGSSQGYLDGTGTNAQFREPQGVAVDSAGNVFVGDSTNHRIRRITPAGVVSTFAGSGTGQGTYVGTFADGTGTNASFNNPQGVAVNSAGNVYVADTMNNRIRMITSSGVVTTLAGSGTTGSSDGTGTNATFNQPNGVAVDSAGNVFVADTENSRIRRITPAGVVTTLAGSTAGFQDGTGTNASFFYPRGIAVDSGGILYVAAQLNNRIRKIV